MCTGVLQVTRSSTGGNLCRSRSDVQGTGEVTGYSGTGVQECSGSTVV